MQQVGADVPGNGGCLQRLLVYYAEFDYVVDAFAIEKCPVDCPVVDIQGLPSEVCVFEEYWVTATGNDLNSLVWGGDATVLSQVGNSALVTFAYPGTDLALWARNGATPKKELRRMGIKFVRIDLESNSACDGASVDVDLVIEPASAKDSIQSVTFSITKPDGSTNFDNPAGQGIEIVTRDPSDLTKWKIDNTRWYSTQSDQCNYTSDYIIYAILQFGNGCAQTKSEVFSADVNSGCISGVTPTEALPDGIPDFVGTQLQNNDWKYEIEIGGFDYVRSASIVLDVLESSQYYIQISEEEQFHKGQFLGTNESTLLAGLYNADSVIDKANARGPFINADQYAAKVAAGQAWVAEVQAENERSLMELANLRCELELEAKNAAGVSHRAAMQCTYPECL